ncbi:error-prone DNA polymerase [Acidipila sp. EB88]|uniref:error-prone DNA polymerase n=1 Tax=Acidipila sp. EB88 TaxID=2305226 RepID=UPI000F601A9E|nr:error-prone DNA polymerase [Acidipila sp. EB88]RRA48312.1 DNA polymerase III subunit alpha [Acidipila sp. EB88]
MTKTQGYVELHARSAFSFLEGASLPEAMTQQAANLGMPALGILDRDGLYGAPRLYTTAQKLGMRSHVGAEISVAELGGQMRPEGWQPHTIPERPVRLSLLCESPAGYQNLSRLITSYKLLQKTKGEGVASLAAVQKHAAGLVCLTGGEEGPLAAALAAGGMEQGRRTLECLVRTFGRDNVYVEVQRHRIREQEARNQAAVALARSMQLPLLATNGANMATPMEREVLDVLSTIRHKCTLDAAGMLLQQNANRHLVSGAEMWDRFGDLPCAVEETGELSKRLQFVMKDMGYRFPLYPIPEGESMDSFLCKRTMEGVVKRYGAKGDAKLRARAEVQVAKELAMIARLGLAGYFLIVWDIVEFCRKEGILVQGRGSAANSAVCYSLGITAVDPVGMELLFERFLSEVRGEWPDIDLDLPSGGDRERAIQYVYTRYGQLGAAMCANVITYRGRSAAREVGKSLGFDEATLTRLTRLVGSWEWKGPTDTMEDQFRTAGFDLAHPRIAKYLELSIRMLDLPRHLGQHSGGMVIAQDQLAAVVPIEPASMPGRTVIQWDKEDCSDMGLIKVDLLGLGMMAVLKDCVELIPRHYGEPVDMAQIPQDAEVYKSLCRADTVGLFQVESRAQMASLPRNMPDRFYDLVVQVAIIRPGPIVGKMMNPYMERRQKRQPVRYPHLLLEPVLKRTLGVPLFQEQLLRIAMTIADFTGGEAEELRRALGSRRSVEKMRALEIKLRKGMDKNGVSPEAQEEILQSISSFALYGFPESHAASFALIAYASAWLKFHYLAAFTAAILNNQPMGFYSAAVLVKDAQRHGLRVKPVDVLRSSWPCTLEQEENGTLSLRLGFCYVRGLQRVSANDIEAARGMRAFASMDELARRVPSLSRANLATLAEIGALNVVGVAVHRREALWQVERAGRRVGPLLAELDRDEEIASPLRAMAPEERMIADYASTGVTVGRHPMAHCRAQLQSLRVVCAGDLRRLRHGVTTRIAGAVIARQRPGTAHGFIFLSIEDESGIANAIIDPDLYEQHRSLVTYARFLLIEGTLQNIDSVIHVRAKHVEELNVAAVSMQSHDWH